MDLIFYGIMGVYGFIFLICLIGGCGDALEEFLTALEENRKWTKKHTTTALHKEKPLGYSKSMAATGKILFHIVSPKACNGIHLAYYLID